MALLGAHTIRLQRLYHVGTKPPSNDAGPARKRGHIMLEGNELSVSMHPDEWRQIARLQGNTYLLENPRGRFLDALESRKVARDYGVKSDFLAPRVVWRVEWFDDELGDTVYTDFSTREEALEEDYEAAGIRKVRSYGFGPAGLAYWSSVTPELVKHDLALAWAPIHLARSMKLDGVWWNERLDVHNYSAPRGCILREAVPRWSVRRVAR